MSPPLRQGLPALCFTLLCLYHSQNVFRQAVSRRVVTRKWVQSLVKCVPHMGCWSYCDSLNLKREGTVWWAGCDCACCTCCLTCRSALGPNPSRQHLIGLAWCRFILHDLSPYPNMPFIHTCCCAGRMRTSGQQLSSSGMKRLAGAWQGTGRALLGLNGLPGPRSTAGSSAARAWR